MNSTNSENISRRPSSIANIINHFEGIFKVAKLLLTLPRPAPAFASDAVIAPKLVIRSLPKANKPIVKNINKAANIEIKAHIDCKTCLGKVLPPNLIL